MSLEKFVEKRKLKESGIIDFQNSKDACPKQMDFGVDIRLYLR